MLRDKRISHRISPCACCRPVFLISFHLLGCLTVVTDICGMIVDVVLTVRILCEYDLTGHIVAEHSVDFLFAELTDRKQPAIAVLCAFTHCYRRIHRCFLADGKENAVLLGLGNGDNDLVSELSGNRHLHAFVFISDRLCGLCCGCLFGGYNRLLCCCLASLGGRRGSRSGCAACCQGQHQCGNNNTHLQ